MKPIYSLYSVEDVESYLKQHPQGFDHKRGYELLAGCILARTSGASNGQEIGVGFRLDSRSNPESMDRPSLSDLLDRYEVEDRDVDIVIGNDFSGSPIQVTRLVDRYQYDSTTTKLRELIDKKLLVQSDPDLVLAVLCDADFELEHHRLHEYLQTRQIPYGRIVLIVPEPVLGQYRCYEIYPELAETPIITIDLGQS